MEYNATLSDFPKYVKKHLHVIQKGKTQEEIFNGLITPYDETLGKPVIETFKRGISKIIFIKY
jgi:hypothetical protein